MVLMMIPAALACTAVLVIDAVLPTHAQTSGSEHAKQTTNTKRTFGLAAARELSMLPMCVTHDLYNACSDDQEHSDLNIPTICFCQTALQDR